jgi:transposase
VDGVRLPPDIEEPYVGLLRKVWRSPASQNSDTSRQTVHKWINRAKYVGREYYEDKPRKPKESEVAVEVELSILKLRTTLR